MENNQYTLQLFIHAREGDFRDVTYKEQYIPLLCGKVSDPVDFVCGVLRPLVEMIATSKPEIVFNPQSIPLDQRERVWKELFDSVNVPEQFRNNIKDCIAALDVDFGDFSDSEMERTNIRNNMVRILDAPLRTVLLNAKIITHDYFNGWHVHSRNFQII